MHDRAGPAPRGGHASEVRLGHALGVRGVDLDPSAVREALDVADGSTTLVARPPQDNACVGRAEEALGVDAASRPVYAYLGDLNPELGSVGLIFHRAWTTRALMGYSRCDTGGMVCGRGGFVWVNTCGDPPETVVTQVSCSSTVASDLDADFSKEVAKAHGGNPAAYVNHVEPKLDTADPRQRCLSHAKSVGIGYDRRLWTWEVRCGSPQPAEVAAIVVSEQNQGRLLDLFFTEGREVPPSVRVLPRSFGGGLPSVPFNDPEVRQLLQGVP